MNTRWIPLAAVVAILLSACSKGGDEGATPEAWVQIEVSVRQMPAKADPARAKAERNVLCTLGVPIPLDGEPGRASCVDDGVRLNVAWKAAKRPPNSQDGVQLEGFRWNIANKVLGGGSSFELSAPGFSKSTILREDFVLLLDPLELVERGTKAELSVRGRCLTTPPELKDIHLDEQPTPQEDPARRRPQVGPF